MRRPGWKTTGIDSASALPEGIASILRNAGRCPH
jgi:hypothetical protein